MRTKIATGLATVGLAALTVTALPGAAHANPEWYSSPVAVEAAAAEAGQQSDASTVSPMGLADCPRTYFCFWVNTNFTGPMGKVAGDNRSWTRFSQPACPTGTWNDCASSGFNNGTSGLGVRVYADTDYRGSSVCLPKGWKGNLTDLGFNDRISSNRWMTC